MLLLLLHRPIITPPRVQVVFFKLTDLFWGKVSAAVAQLVSEKVSVCERVEILSSFIQKTVSFFLFLFFSYLFLLWRCQESPKTCSMSLPQCVSQWHVKRRLLKEDVTCDLQGTRKSSASSFSGLFPVESICILHVTTDKCLCPFFFFFFYILFYFFKVGQHVLWNNMMMFTPVAIVELNITIWKYRINAF